MEKIKSKVVSFNFYFKLLVKPYSLQKSSFSFTFLVLKIHYNYFKLEDNEL